MWYDIGQFIGYLALLACVLSFQAKEKARLLFMQTVATALLCIHYGLIGAWSGLAINAVCLVRNIVYTNRDKKPFQHKAWPYIFAGIIVVVGLFSWDDWYSAVLLAAIAINSIVFAHPDANFVRKSMLLTSPMIFLYDFFCFSIGGMINQTISFLSAIVGLIRHGKRKKKEKNTKK